MTTTHPDTAELLRLPATELLRRLEACGVQPSPNLDRAELLAALLHHYFERGDRIELAGVLEVLPEGFGFLRYAAHDFAAGAADVYLSPSQVRGLNLKTGHALRGPARGPQGKERFLALLHVDTVGDRPPTALADAVTFAARTPVVPTRALALGGDTPLAALLTALCPWQRGQRLLVRTPAACGGNALLVQLAAAMAAAANAPLLSLCLLDQRPEDIARARAAASGAQLVATMFDAAPDRHVAVAELALAQACRQVENGADVVLLLDSLTALARAAQLTEEPSGRFLCPGLDARAVAVGKRLFAAARACAEGGSLTIVATATAGHGAIEQAVMAEFERRSNGELVVDAQLAAAMAPLPFDLRRTAVRPEDDARPAAARAAGLALRERLLALPPAQWPHAVRDR